MPSTPEIDVIMLKIQWYQFPFVSCVRVIAIGLKGREKLYGEGYVGKILKPTAMWLNQCVCPEASAIPSEFIVSNFGFILCLNIILKISGLPLPTHMTTIEANHQGSDFHAIKTEDTFQHFK